MDKVSEGSILIFRHIRISLQHGNRWKDAPMPKTNLIHYSFRYDRPTEYRLVTDRRTYGQTDRRTDTHTRR